MIKYLPILLLFLSGCYHATALSLIKQYNCRLMACTYPDGSPVEEGCVGCDTEPPDEHKYILGCKYKPLLDR